MTDDYTQHIQTVTRGVGEVMAGVEGKDIDALFGTDDVRVICTGWQTDRDYNGSETTVHMHLTLVPREADDD